MYRPKHRRVIDPSPGYSDPRPTGLLLEEIHRFDDTPNREHGVSHDIRWPSAGQTFER